MADSLEDNFALEDEFRSVPHNGTVSSSSQLNKGTKRVRQAPSDSGSDNEERLMKLAAGASSAAKKARRKERQKVRQAKRAEVRREEEETRQNPATLPPEFQADWLRRELRQCKTWKELSEIEMDERTIPESCLIDSTSWQDKARDVDSLPDFVRKLASRGTDLIAATDSPLLAQKGTPAILVLTNNALRAAHLARSLRSLLPGTTRSTKSDKSGESKGKATKGKSTRDEEEDGDTNVASSAQGPSLQIAKLFSRHFSPKQQIEYLASHHVAAGAGTAQRLASLIAQDAVKLNHLKVLVLDATWRDDKMRALLDEEGGREGVKDTWEALREKAPHVKVLLF